MNSRKALSETFFFSENVATSNLSFGGKEMGEMIACAESALAYHVVISELLTEALIFPTHYVLCLSSVFYLVRGSTIIRDRVGRRAF